MNKYVIVGAGIAGLLTAFFLKKKEKNCKIFLIEKEKECGGILNSFKYSNKHGIFDYGIHTIYETGNLDLDRTLNSFLPKKDWIKLSGLKRDFGGTYFNGVLQDNSAYLDIRNINSKKTKIYKKDFLKNLKNQNNNKTKNAYELLKKKFGSKITKDIFSSILHKIYSFSLKETHPFIVQLLPLNRIVLYENDEMMKFGKLKYFNDHIAYPDQLDMPKNLISNKSAWYPKKYGMYRFIKAIKNNLIKKNVIIKNNCKIEDIIQSKKNTVSYKFKNSRNTIDEVDQVLWTSGIPSAYFTLMNNSKKNINFDKPVKTMFVNIGLNKKPLVKDLYYIYCLEKNFITHRISCPSSFCPKSYSDGVYRLTIELILKKEMNNDSIKKKVLDELEIMKVINRKNVKFLHLENILGGYPTISLKNIKVIEKMKSIILDKYPKNFKFLGLMSKPNLFFQTDIMKDIYNEVGI